MGVFKVPIEVSNLEWRGIERVEAWVDTGALYTNLPRPLVESLGIVPHKRAPRRGVLDLIAEMIWNGRRFGSTRNEGTVDGRR